MTEITPESIRERYIALTKTHRYCAGCGKPMALNFVIEYAFNRMTGVKQERYTVHEWVCSKWRSWRSDYGSDASNPHDYVALGGLFGGPVRVTEPAKARFATGG